VEEMISRDPEINGVFTIVGFSFSGAASNQAILFANLRPFEERKGDAHSAATIIQRLRGKLSAVSGALVVPFNPPAVQGQASRGISVRIGRSGTQFAARHCQRGEQTGCQGQREQGCDRAFLRVSPRMTRNILFESTVKKRRAASAVQQITDALQVYMDRCT